MMMKVSLQFIAQSNSEEEKYFKNPFEFKLNGQISSFFKVHGSLSIATLRNVNLKTIPAIAY